MWSNLCIFFYFIYFFYRTVISNPNSAKELPVFFLLLLLLLSFIWFFLNIELDTVYFVYFGTWHEVKMSSFFSQIFRQFLNTFLCNLFLYWFMRIYIVLKYLNLFVVSVLVPVFIIVAFFLVFFKKFPASVTCLIFQMSWGLFFKFFS